MLQNQAKENKLFNRLKKEYIIAIIIAVFFSLLLLSLDGFIFVLIDKTLIPITRFFGCSNVFLDLLFIVVTLCCVYHFIRYWCLKPGRIVSPWIAGSLLFFLVLYVFFRICNDYYLFTCYWNGPIAYLDGLALIGALKIILGFCQYFKKNGDGISANGPSFKVDEPIETAVEDVFNMESVVKRIVSYIDCTDVSKKAFSMGIVGNWGDGKTSLMNLVEEKINERSDDFVVVHFNPRASKKADYIQEDFLEALKKSLTPLHSGINRTIDNYAVALDAVPGIPTFVSKTLSLFQIHFDKKRHSKKEVLKNAIEKIGKRVVVLIDDLDRLTGEELIEVLKILDSNGAFPRLFFLTTYDKDYVNTVLNKYLQLGTQRRPYTDKYFTVEVHVPLHPSFRMMEYFVDLLKKALEDGFIKPETIGVDDLEKQTLQLISYFKHRLRTVRDIKRFVNQFLYDYAEVQRDVDYRDFLLLELIKFAHPDEYEAIHRLEYIHKGSGFTMPSASNDLYYLNEFVTDGQKVQSSDILQVLFPSEKTYESWYANRYLRIYCVSSFEHYFYNYEFSHLKRRDLEGLFKTDRLSDACKMIDDWMPNIKDLETFLLTRDIKTIYDKQELKKYFQYLLYAGFKKPSINYMGFYYSFLISKDVNVVIKNCDFKSPEEYIKWLKNSLDELFEINPTIPSSYVISFINSSYSDVNSGSFVWCVEDLQAYALKLLGRYLSKINEEGWSARIAYQMAQIPTNRSGGIFPKTYAMLRDSIEKNFDSYSSEMPVVFDNQDGTHVGYLLVVINDVFGDCRDKFRQIIYDKKHDNSPEIKLIRAIWPLFEANDYKAFSLPKGTNAKKAKQTFLQDATNDLEKYNAVNEKLVEIEHDWKTEKNKAANVGTYIKNIEKVRRELNGIPLRLKIAEGYAQRMDNMIIEFRAASN